MTHLNPRLVMGGVKTCSWWVVVRCAYSHTIGVHELLLSTRQHYTLHAYDLRSQTYIQCQVILGWPQRHITHSFFFLMCSWMSLVSKQCNCCQEHLHRPDRGAVLSAIIFSNSAYPLLLELRETLECFAITHRAPAGRVHQTRYSSLSSWVWRKRHHCSKNGHVHLMFNIHNLGRWHTSSSLQWFIMRQNMQNWVVTCQKVVNDGNHTSSLIGKKHIQEVRMLSTPLPFHLIPFLCLPTMA